MRIACGLVAAIAVAGCGGQTVDLGGSSDSGTQVSANDAGAPPGNPDSSPPPPPSAITLVDGLDQPSFIVVDDTSVYFTIWHSTSSQDSAVMKAPIGGGPATTLAVSHGAPGGIALWGGNVYWTAGSATSDPSNPSNLGAGTLMEVPSSGGPAVTLAGGQTGPIGPAVDATGVYWVNDGPPESLTSGVMRVALDGGTPEVLAPGQPYSGGITVGSMGVYWTPQGAMGNQSVVGNLAGEPLDGGALMFLIHGGPFLWPLGAVASDGTAVFVLENTNGYGVAIYRSPFDRSPPMPVSAQTPGEGFGIAIDGTNAYWCGSGSVAGTTEGYVATAPLDGSPSAAAVMLATGQWGPVNVAVDATHIYWTASGPGENSGQVMMAPK